MPARVPVCAGLVSGHLAEYVQDVITAFGDEFQVPRKQVKPSGPMDDGSTL